MTDEEWAPDFRSRAGNEDQHYQQRVIRMTGILDVADPQVLLRADLGAFGFGELAFELRTLVSLTKWLDTPRLMRMPFKLLENGAFALHEVEEALNAMRLFDPADANAHERRMAVLHKSRDGLEKAAGDLAPIVAFAAAVSDQDALDASMADARSGVASLVAEQTAAMERIRRDTASTTTILAAARQAAQEVNVGKHAEHFMQQATEHNDASQRWLLAVVFSSLATLALAVWNYVRVDAGQVQRVVVTPGSVAEVVVAKLLVASVVLAVPITCVKMYRSHRHNYIVNKHRQNALSSFNTFAQAADDPQTKSAVLLQATQSIFAPQATGYVGQENDGASPIQMIEMVRTIADSKK